MTETMTIEEPTTETTDAAEGPDRVTEFLKPPEPVLKWENYDNSEDDWQAENTAGVKSSAEPDMNASFFVDQHEKNGNPFYLVEEDVALLDDIPSVPFDTADAAKSWCEQRNAELAAAAQQPTEATPEPVDPAEMSRHLGTIEAQERVVYARKVEWETLKEQTSAAKKAFEDAGERLCDIIRRHSTPAPLFDDPALRQPATDGQDDAPPEDDAWRAVVIADLEPKLKPGKLKALAENTPPILTMGEMADWQQAKGEFWMKDIKGFGPGGAEQYAVACDAYWAAHPRDPVAADGLTNQPETDASLDTPSPASSAPASPGDLEIDGETIIVHCESVKGGGTLTLSTAQRGSGQYCYSYAAEVGIFDRNVKWTGRFPDLATAIFAAVEDCSTWLTAREPNISSAKKAELRGIRAALADLSGEPVKA